MARDVVVRLLRLFGRLLLWCLLLVVLLTLPVMGMLGSEAGSRWLLERGLGMQRMLTLEVRGGTLLEGMDLAEVRWHTRKSDLYIRHVLARWSLLQLLRGEIDILQLQAEGVTLTLTSPSSRDPVRLPRLILPLALDIHSLELTDVRVRKRGSEWPVARITAKGYWRGATVIVDRLQAQAPRYGGLTLAGEIRLLGGYPLRASGQLSPRWLSEKGWQPLQVSLSGTVASLDIKAASRGRYHANLAGNVRPLLPDTPYSALLDWSDLLFPWITPYAMQSREGSLKIIGDRHGLRSQGEMDLQTKYTPRAACQWQLDTDWHGATFESLKINTLDGEIKAKGNVGWPSSGLRWDVTAALSKVDLARRWPVPRSILPVLSGSFASKGHSSEQGSGVEASLKLLGGERWSVADKASGVLWSPQSLHKGMASWGAVKRQVAGLRFVQSDSGRLAFDGNRNAYTAEFSTGMATGVMPVGAWRGQVSGAGKHLNVEALSYAGDAGALQAGGEIDFGKGISWRGALVLDEFNSAWLTPEWSGQFSGSVSGQGEWAAHRREIDLGDVNITGQLRDQPLRLDGPIHVRLRDGAWPHVASPGFKAGWGGNLVVLDGGLQEQWNATVSLDLANPEVLMPGLLGRIQGSAVLSGPERAPDVLLDLTMAQGAYGGHTAQSARLQAVVPGFGEAHGNIALALSGITTKSGMALGDLTLAANGVIRDHQLEWRLQGAPVSMAGKLAGGLDRQTGNWQGSWQQGLVSIGELQWQLSAEAPLSWAQASHELQLGGHCWQSIPASLCVSEPMVIGPSGSMAVSLNDFQAERLASFMPEGVSWLGSIAGEVKAEWRPGQAPTAKALLHTESGEVRLARDDAAPLSMRYDQLRIALEADASVVNSRITLASGDLGNAQLDATINPFVEGRPMAGEVTLSGLRMELLQPFLPALSQLTGLVSAEGRLDGSLAHPRYWGSLQLKDGKLALRNAPFAVDDMSVWVDVQGDSAEFSGQLHSGEGGATLGGRANWSDQPRLVLDLQGSRFAVRQEPEILAELSPDLHIDLQPGQLALTGTVGVPYARINLKKLPERSVGLSSDVRVIESADGRLRASTTKRGQALTINADVELALGKDVFFNGFGVIGALNGGVHLRQSAQRGLEAYGELGLDKEARYEAYGQKLKVRSGRLVFAGNISQPAIDAEAIREVDDKVVGIRVEGRANAPEATLFSEPTMPQGDMLSYLVLGRPLAQRTVEGSSNGNDAMLAAAAIKLGARGGAGLTSGIGSALGVRDLSLDAEGSGDDTQVKVSGYISPDLYLSYGVGVFTPVNTVTMRYQVRPRLYLEAVSSLENAIDLFYNFRF